jgi:hypothetical protein
VYERARTSMRVHAWVRVRVCTCTYMCVGVCCISRYTVTRHESAKGTGSTKIRGQKTRCMIAQNKSGHFKEKTLQYDTARECESASLKRAKRAPSCD